MPIEAPLLAAPSNDGLDSDGGTAVPHHGYRRGDAGRGGEGRGHDGGDDDGGGPGGGQGGDGDG